MKTFTVNFKNSDEYEAGHQDKGRVLEDGRVEVWCPWDGRWIPFPNMEILRMAEPYSEEQAEFVWDEANE